MRLRLAPLALLTVAAMWGSTFFMMKEAIQRQDVNSFLFTRFSVAVIAMLLIRPQVVKLFNRDMVTKGVISGTFLAAGYIFQTFGLALTSAAVTGFITGLYVIATPLMAALFLGQKISKKVWFYVAIATFGLGLLSLHGWSMGRGELLVLACALAYAGQIIALSKWSKGRDAYALTILQLITCAVLSGLATFINGYQLPPDAGVWGVVTFTAIFATALAFMVQTWSQAHISATKVAVILTMETVFAAVFAVIFGGEHLTLKIVAGGTMVVAAMYMIVLEEA
ncbi:MAG: DMT family transporter [Candidatus Nanopelagicaceae bacterium]|nr:DMT family transporter [Candidatus Nanopelagicaceae bacterium]